MTVRAHRCPTGPAYATYRHAAMNRWTVGAAREPAATVATSAFPHRPAEAIMRRPDADPYRSPQRRPSRCWISSGLPRPRSRFRTDDIDAGLGEGMTGDSVDLDQGSRSEEHTSEL